jgi:Ca2+-binding RTX toxin-like protein
MARFFSMTNPTDPLYSQQWHFGLIGDIQTIWDEYDGSGVHVGVYDDGVQYNHPDLADNYDASLHFRHGGVTYDAMPIAGTDSHGTACAGLIGAQNNNGIGGAGVAHGVTMTGVNFLDDIQNRGNALIDAALRWAANFDIMSNSWGRRAGYEPDQSLARDPSVSGSARFDAIYAEIAANGRGGLGTVIVQAAGNDTLNSNGDGVNASRYTITVAATEWNGMVADYSNYGVGILLAAPASAVTTDRTGEDGTNRSGTGDGDPLPVDYTSTFNGTSAATPTVAGVVALMLQANEELGWRDVKNILAHSAKHTGSAYDAAPSFVEHGGWGSGSGTQWNGGGSVFHQSYGFGMLNAYAAVRMAEVWTTLHDTSATSANEMVATKVSAGGSQYIPDATFDFYYNIIPGERYLGFNVTDDVQIETAYVTVNLEHQRGYDLSIYLVMPDGDALPIMINEDAVVNATQTGLIWTFEVEALRGMSSRGNWQVVIQDNLIGASGIVHGVKLDFFGSASSADDVYTYTQDFLALRALQPARGQLNDLNGGKDWINMAAIAGNVTASLDGGGAVRVNGTQWFTLAANADFENIVTGDGNDSVTGNSLNNHIMGMRGNDTLLGQAGNDTLLGGTGNDLLDGGGGNDTAVFTGSAKTTVNLNLSAAQNTGHGMDRIINIENVLSDMGHDRLVGNGQANRLESGDGKDKLTGGGANDTLLGGNGHDTLKGDAGNDVLNGGTGKDTAVFSGSAAATVDLGVKATQNTGHGLDRLLGIENVKSGSGNDRLTGNGAVNILNAGGGKDTLTGNGGNDKLLGGKGNDVLNGGAGKDILIGGTGRDNLTGGGDADVFVFLDAADLGNTSSKRDVITDFAQGVDRIDLSGIDARAGGGNQAFDFIGKIAFSGTMGELKFQNAGGLTLVRGDMDGDGAGDFQIALTGLFTLTAADFIL